MPEVATVLQMPRLWPKTIRMHDQNYKCQGYGQRQSECTTKVRPSKDRKSLKPAGQSNWKKTRAIVAKPMEMMKRLLRVCWAQKNDGQIFIGVGMNGVPVKLL